MRQSPAHRVASGSGRFSGGDQKVSSAAPAPFRLKLKPWLLQPEPRPATCKPLGFSGRLAL